MRDILNENTNLIYSLCHILAAYQILSKAKKLRGVEKFKRVYLPLDRTEEDRIKQRELVQEMKKLSAEKPVMRHFIRDGKVVCVDKT